MLAEELVESFEEMFPASSAELQGIYEREGYATTEVALLYELRGSGTFEGERIHGTRPYGVIFTFSDDEITNVEV